MSSSSALAAPQALRLMQAGRLDEARVFAERAVAAARACLPAHGLLAAVLLKLGRAEEAEQTVAHALELAPGDADAYDGLAWVSMALGRHERANALYRRATEVAPRDPRYWYNLACSERSLGRLIEAEAACDRAIALDATQYGSYLLRSELRVQSAAENHIGELQALLARADAPYRAQVFLGYALGKELDDLGRYDEAFRCFARAARARRARLDYDVAVDERKLARIAEVYSHEFFAGALHAAPGLQTRSGPIDSSRYIFILGLPRSGTTLVERIVSGLPGVRSNGETDNFSRALLEAARGTGDVFQRAAAADPQAVAAAYARLADPGVGATRIIEKLPLNYLYLGAIKRALPQAAIVLVSRSPLDSCFAMYRTLFGGGSLQLRPRRARSLLRRLRPAHGSLAGGAWRRLPRGRVLGAGARAATRRGRARQRLRTRLGRCGGRDTEQQVRVADRKRRTGAPADLRQLLRPLAPLPPASRGVDRRAVQPRNRRCRRCRAQRVQRYTVPGNADFHRRK